MAALLQTKEIAITFGGIKAVRGVDIEIASGELVCIIGPNGAGKSSLLNVISGTMVPTAGTVSFEGRELRPGNPAAFARAGIVRKFQGTNTFQWLSVRDNLLVAAAGVAGHREGDPPYCDALMRRLGLTECADQVAELLPHGKRQWLEIGMALMCRPRLLLLDEPGAGMDARDGPILAQLLKEMPKDCGVIVIEHDMAFVRSLDCRTLVMHQGALVRDGRFQDVADDPEIREIYLGRRAGGERHA